jgi:hypothetical protein
MSGSPGVRGGGARPASPALDAALSVLKARKTRATDL